MESMIRPEVKSRQFLNSRVGRYLLLHQQVVPLRCEVRRSQNPCEKNTWTRLLFLSSKTKTWKSTPWRETSRSLWVPGCVYSCFLKASECCVLVLLRKQKTPTPVVPLCVWCRRDVKRSIFYCPFKSLSYVTSASGFTPLIFAVEPD